MAHPMQRRHYADMFGPTTGDRVRLGDTSLVRLPLDWPTPLNRRVKEARAAHDVVVYRILEERKRDPKPHDDLLANATSVHVESLVDDPAQLMAFAQRMMQPSPVPLSQRVAAADFEALVAQLGAFPRERLDSLRPWAAFFVVLSVRLTRSLQAHAAEAGTDPAAPAMDAVVLQRTRERQLLPQPLEQMSELADIFEGLDEGVYLAMLADFAQPLPEDGSDPEAEQLAQLVAAYRAGDLDAVSTLVDALNSGESHSAFFRMLIAQRNTLWMTRLTRAFNEGGAFVAVGAAHLPGPEGLLQQLGAAGFVVTRL